MHRKYAAVSSKGAACQEAVVALFPMLQLQQQHVTSLLGSIADTTLWGMQIRLTTLFDVVDFFVIVESRVTHQGRPKALHYADNKRRFGNFAAKIAHVVLDQLQGEYSYFKCAVLHGQVIFACTVYEVIVEALQLFSHACVQKVFTV